jgi:hypothetical protein
VLVIGCSAAAPPRATPVKETAPPAAADERWCIQKVQDTDGNLVLVTVDVALRGYPSQAQYPFIVHVKLTTREQDAYGLPTDHEAAVLNQVEGGISRELLGGGRGIFVGRTTTKGFRELMYYVRDAKLAEKTLARLAKSAQPRHWEFRSERDASWKTVEPLLRADAECL